MVIGETIMRVSMDKSEEKQRTCMVGKLCINAMHAGHYAHFCWLGSGIFLSFVSIETLVMRTYFMVVLVLSEFE